MSVWWEKSSSGRCLCLRTNVVCQRCRCLSIICRFVPKVFMQVFVQLICNKTLQNIWTLWHMIDTCRLKCFSIFKEQRPEGNTGARFSLFLLESKITKTLSWYQHKVCWIVLNLESCSGKDSRDLMLSLSEKSIFWARRHHVTLQLQLFGRYV